MAMSHLGQREVASKLCGQSKTEEADDRFFKTAVCV